MRKQDYNGVRTAVDVERRHNLGAIPGLESDVNELKTDQIIDTSLSGTSEHAVQNKVITTAINSLDTNKVDKVAGKGLSTNDFTNLDKDSIHAHSNKLLLDTITNNNLYDIDKAYPINSVYLSITNANPDLTLGGTWTYIDSTTIGTTTIYAFKRTS